MVNMDTRLPLLVQQPDIVNALATGTRAAADQANVLRAAEGQNIFRQHGANAMQGNANALAAIAGFDPTVAQGIQANSLDMDATRLNMDVSRARIQQIKSETARALAAAQDQAQAQREAQEAIRLSNDAFMAWKRGDTARWSQITGLMGASDIPMDEEGVAIVGAIAAGASAFEAARGVRPEPDYVTLNDQLVDRNAPDGPAVVPVAGMGARSERDPAAELKIQRLMETRKPDGSFLTREEAIGIADGRMVLTQLGELMDKATGTIVESGSLFPTAPSLGATPAPNVPVTPELPPLTRSALPADGVDYRGAFGAEGAVTGAVNAIVDFAIGERPFQEQGRARTALGNLRTRTLTTLASASVAGRPSNYVMEMFNQNVAQPTLGSGAGGALDTAEQTLAFLDAMIAENQAVLNSRVDQNTRSTARRSIEALAGLRQDYQIVVEGLRGTGEQSAAPIPDGAPMPPDAANHPVLSSTAANAGVSVEEIWQNLSPEDRAKFGFTQSPVQAPTRAPSAQERRRGG